jgi:hypothetical protein
MAKRTRKAIEQIRALLVSRAWPQPTVIDASWPPSFPPQTLNEQVLLALPLFGSFRPAQLREFIAPLKRQDFVRGDLANCEP